MSVVVDANVMVAVIIADVHQQVAREHLWRWFEVGEDLHVPAVLPYEVANVLARLVFEQQLQIDELPAIWQDLFALGLIVHPFDFVHDGPAVGAVTARLRRRHATDATYVHLAQQLGSTLWTLDGALARNAADVGLPVRLVE